MCVCDIDADALAALPAAVPGVVTQQCDVADRGEVERMVAAAVGALGGLDVLINNAGISGPTAPVEAMDPDAREKVLRVNLAGTLNVTRLSIPHLKRSRAGVIINMSSAAGRFGYPNRNPYSTSKLGLIGSTKALSIELGEFGIRANAILPGAVEGPRLRRVFEGRTQQSRRSVEEVSKAALGIQSIKEFVRPADIAALAMFLASDSARSISGQMLPIDGDMQSAV